MANKLKSKCSEDYTQAREITLACRYRNGIRKREPKSFSGSVTATLHYPKSIDGIQKTA
jgi:hypothetical protein